MIRIVYRVSIVLLVVSLLVIGRDDVNFSFTAVYDMSIMALLALLQAAEATGHTFHEVHPLFHGLREGRGYPLG